MDSWVNKNPILTLRSLIAAALSPFPSISFFKDLSPFAVYFLTSHSLFNKWQSEFCLNALKLI